MDRYIIKIAQTLTMARQSVSSDYIKGLKPGDFFARKWKKNFGRELAVSLTSTKTIYFKSPAIYVREQFKVLTKDELPQEIQDFPFDEFSSRIIFEGFIYSSNREYEFYVIGYKRKYRMILGIANEAVKKLDQSSNVNEVVFFSVEKQSKFGVWYATDVKQLKEPESG